MERGNHPAVRSADYLPIPKTPRDEPSSTNDPEALLNASPAVVQEPQRMTGLISGVKSANKPSIDML